MEVSFIMLIRREDIFACLVVAKNCLDLPNSVKPHVVWPERPTAKKDITNQSRRDFC